jgi:hypothetical protein
MDRERERETGERAGMEKWRRKKTRGTISLFDHHSQPGNMKHCYNATTRPLLDSDKFESLFRRRTLTSFQEDL